MPKRSSAYISDSHEASDHDDADSTAAPLKKPKTSSFTPASNVSNGLLKTDDNGDTFWELNAKGTRRVTISEFKGRNMVNLREYYEKDGKMLPGKKGISLVMEQFSAFLEAMPQIEAMLRAKGEQIPRPDYEGHGSTSGQKSTEEASRVPDEGKADNDNAQKVKKHKANYEDTSDEGSMLE